MNPLKQLVHAVTTRTLRDYVRLRRLDFVANPPIVVFQMGKVGSTAVHSLLRDFTSRPVYHAHYLSDEGTHKAKRWHIQKQGKAPYGVTYFRLLGQKIRRDFEKVHWTVITGIREPIAKEISVYFELADKIDMGLRRENGAFDESLIREYLVRRFRSFERGEPEFFTTQWFDQEMKAVFGVDVFQHDFDKDAGYSVIRKGNVDLLLYQFERIGEVLQPGLSELLPNMQIPLLERCNVGSNKWYAELYENTKKSLSLSPEVCDAVYGCRYLRHFYSESDIQSFKTRWTA